jgi:hypothetical protein
MTFRICAVALLLCFNACTPLRPRVSFAPGASLKGYRVFVVAPVADETGERFNLDVGDSLREEITRRLRSHGITAVRELPTANEGPDDPVPAVIITSALIGFRGIPMWLQVPARGVTGCELRSELRDHQTGERLGVIVAADLAEEYSPMVMLARCAHDVADAIDRRLRGERKSQRS